MLTDNHGRLINYVRIAVTDRCNLRCYYCMPEEGLNWIRKDSLLSSDEVVRTCTVLAQMGIEKIRITGGEPFIRKDIIRLLQDVVRIKGIKEVSVTTNGVLAAPFIPILKELGITSVNLSLDTLDPDRFLKITRRNVFGDVMNTLDTLLHHNMNIKINCVVMDGMNTCDIGPLCELTQNLPVAVRFIEEMPFNGQSHEYAGLKWDYIQILQTIRSHFPSLEKMQDPAFSTSYNYKIPGYKGCIGIIAAYSRSFCGTCNRLRITPQGQLQTCLYGEGVLNIKNLIRAGADNNELENEIRNAVQHRHRDGWEAEKYSSVIDLRRSMAGIGG